MGSRVPYALFALMPLLLVAASPGAVPLGSGSLFQVTVTGTIYTCGKIDDTWRAGKLTSSGLFLSFSRSAKNVRAKALKSYDPKRSKLLATSKKQRSQARTGDPICLQYADSLGGSAPVPTVQPTASSGTGNFDSAGNVTEAGRSLFSIPTGLAANTSTGSTLYSQRCVGCHDQYQSRTFSTYRSKSAEFPMSFDETTLPDSDLAHITAYLNRFRL